MSGLTKDALAEPLSSLTKRLDAVSLAVTEERAKCADEVGLSWSEDERIATSVNIPCRDVCICRSADKCSNEYSSHAFSMIAWRAFYLRRFQSCTSLSMISWYFQ